MNLENEMFEARIKDDDMSTESIINLHDAIRIAKEYAEKRYNQAQYDLIIMIIQDMFNACSLNLPLEYVGNLKKQLKSKLATETEK